MTSLKNGRRVGDPIHQSILMSTQQLGYRKGLVVGGGGAEITIPTAQNTSPRPSQSLAELPCPTPTGKRSSWPSLP